MARELVDGVWALDLGLRPPLASRAYLVDGTVLPGDDDAVTLVDAGLRWNRPSIRSELDAAGFAPAALDRALVTHYDLDHVGGLPTLRPDFSGPVHLGRPDYDLARRSVHPPLAHHKGLFHRITRRLVAFPDGFDVRPVDDGDRIGAFAAYLTPGHNPGHAVFVHDAGVAFLGDLVWNANGELSIPAWYDSYDVAAIRESLREFLARCGDFEVAAMAHGAPIERDGARALRRLADEL